MDSSAFTFEDTKPVISDDDLLADLRAVATTLGALTLPQQKYPGTRSLFDDPQSRDASERGNAAVAPAGLGEAARRDISSADLFDNLRDVWMKLGRQPRKRDMVKPLSSYTHHPYSERHGGWVNAIRAFLVFVQQAEQPRGSTGQSPVARGPRDPSLRLRFLVMRRDSFKCRHCGKSPAVHAGLELHVDHVAP